MNTLKLRCINFCITLTGMRKGPLYDNDGKLRVEAGKKITDEQMANMSWHVAGVITSLKNR